MNNIFFCRLVAEAPHCTLISDGAGGGLAVVGLRGVAGFLRIQTVPDTQSSVVVVEGGAKWLAVAGEGCLSVGGRADDSVQVRGRGGGVGLARIPQVAGLSIMPLLEGVDIVGRWVFDIYEGGNSQAESGGLEFLQGGVRLTSWGGSTEGAALVSPFETSFALDPDGARAGVEMTRGGGRFSATLSKGSQGLIILQGGGGGIITPSSAGRYLRG